MLSPGHGDQPSFRLDIDADQRQLTSGVPRRPHRFGGNRCRRQAVIASIITAL